MGKSPLFLALECPKTYEDIQYGDPLSQSPSFPESSRQQLVPSILDPYLPYLEKRFQAGCHNAHQPWREIEAQGYSGAVSQVRKWPQWRRKQSATGSAPQAVPITPIFLLPEVSEMYKLLLTNWNTLAAEEQWLLQRLRQIPEIEQIDDLVQQACRPGLHTLL